MSLIALAQAILLPTTAALIIALFERIGRNFLRNAKSDNPAQSASWPLQNRAAYEYILIVRYLSIFGAMLASISCSLSYSIFGQHQLWLLIAVVLFMILLPSILSKGYLDKLREHWGRVDLSTHRSVFSLGALRFSVYPFLLGALAFAPHEVSSLLFLRVVGSLAIAIYWNSWGGIQICRLLRVIQPATPEWEA